MRAAFLRNLACLLVVSVGIATASCAQIRVASPTVGRGQWKEVPKKVLAFYYGWYGNPVVSGRWVHWQEVDEAKQSIGNSTHYPQLGPYDSHDPEVVAQHFRWVKEAGIDVLIATWWTPTGFHDQGLPLLLDTAQKFGLEITAYLETAPAGTREQTLQYVLYLLSHYGAHPAWLRLDGKPVLFVYGRVIEQVGLDGWRWVIAEANRQYPLGAVFIGDELSREAASIFDGIHTYNITDETARRPPVALRAWARQWFPQVMALTRDRIVCLTVIPGYDDNKLGRPKPRPITDRYKGQTYRILWEEAIAAEPDWVVITSWNEWHEGSEIEPSVENGARELRATEHFAREFKAQLPRRLN